MEKFTQSLKYVLLQESRHFIKSTRTPRRNRNQECIPVNGGTQFMLLINPAKRKFGMQMNEYLPLAVPMALGSLASFLTARGHEVRIFDEELTGITDTNIDEIVRGLEKPYVFGLSILTAQACRAYELA